MMKVIKEVKVQVLYDTETSEYYINGINIDEDNLLVYARRRKTSLEDIDGCEMLAFMEARNQKRG